MLLQRGRSEPDQKRKQFASAMGSLWTRFEKIVSPAFRGYVYGDLLYFSRPALNNQDEFEFTPNTVTYEIAKESELGEKIQNSSAGIVVHHYRDFDGNTVAITDPLEGIDYNRGIFVVGLVSVTEPPEIDTAQIQNVRKFVKSNAAIIDSLLDDSRLADSKLSDFKNILYNFVNQQVKTRDLVNLNARFDKWLANSKVSAPKQAKIKELRETHAQAFSAIFSVLEQIMQLKDSIIDQLDQSSPVKSRIGSESGGEGYVKGNIKLVPRAKFTAANIEKHS
jgi:hypothetical protein